MEGERKNQFLLKKWMLVEQAKNEIFFFFKISLTV